MVSLPAMCAFPLSCSSSIECGCVSFDHLVGAGEQGAHLALGLPAHALTPQGRAPKAGLDGESAHRARSILLDVRAPRTLSERGDQSSLFLLSIPISNPSLLPAAWRAWASPSSVSRRPSPPW